MRKIVIKSALLQKNIAEVILFLEYESVYFILCEVNRKYSKKKEVNHHIVFLIISYAAIAGLTIQSMLQVDSSVSERSLPTGHKVGIWITGIAWTATLVAGFWLSNLEMFGLWTSFSILLMALVITAESFTYSKWQTVILVPTTAVFFTSGIAYIW
jgi:hypothetical protein